MTPRISVVIATYNASHVLRHAIASVRLQDREDWELIVVGDHCTDDTEAVVASFCDERIHFENLPRNSGQQATPNNVGVRRARGEYLAFLNHDDLFLPDHLSTNLAALERSGADLVCAPCATVPPEQADAIAAREILARADGFEPTGRFSPTTFHVASTWFLRRSAAQRVGPWRLEDRCWVTPSQDWLFRAWRRGVRIHCGDQITVVVLYSGLRRDAYRRRESPEHDFVFAEVIGSERLRPALLAQAQSWIEEQTEFDRRRRRRRRRQLQSGKRLETHLRDGLAYAAQSVASRLGIHPLALTMRRRYGRRGGFIAQLKDFTG